LSVQAFLSLIDEMFPMPGLNRFLGANRYQYTDHNDCNFTNKFTPAVYGFWKMEVHKRKVPSHTG